MSDCDTLKRKLKVAIVDMHAAVTFLTTDVDDHNDDSDDAAAATCDRLAALVDYAGYQRNDWHVHALKGRTWQRFYVCPGGDVDNPRVVVHRHTLADATHLAFVGFDPDPSPSRRQQG